MAFVPLAGFAPDADPTTPGILLECDGWIPSPKGMRSAYSPSDAGYAALSAACVGFYFSRYSDGTNKCYAGTSTGLWELSSGTWTDRTRAASAYTATTTWRWVTAGNVTYASNIYNKIQSATTGVFADITAAPKAALLASAYGFLIAGNYDTGSAVPDGIFWSAQYDATNWTPDVATQCGYARLLDTPGELTALRTLNEQVVAYKARSMYLGSYQGPPLIWSFRLLSADIGAVSQEGIVDVGYAHLFVGYNEIWIFDGSVPRPISAGLREYFFGAVDRSFLHRIQGLYDRNRGLVYWFYPVGGGAGALTHFIVYNIITGKWGAGRQAIECAGEALTPSTTWDSWADGKTWDALITGTWDGAVEGSARPYPAVFLSTHKMAYLSGVSGTCTFTTGRAGTEDQVALLRCVSPRWLQEPQSAALINYYTQTAGAALTEGATTTMGIRKRFDVLRAAKWHALRLTTTGNAELAGINIDVAIQGRE